LNVSKQFGTAVPQVVVAGSDLTGTFLNEEKESTVETTVFCWIFKDKATADKFIGKVGDVVTVNTNGLFEDAHQLDDERP
jgi:trigger factor